MVLDRPGLGSEKYYDVVTFISRLGRTVYPTGGMSLRARAILLRSLQQSSRHTVTGTMLTPWISNCRQDRSWNVALIAACGNTKKMWYDDSRPVVNPNRTNKWFIPY